MEPFALIICFVFLALVIRLLAGSFDGERVKEHFQSKGYDLLDCSWDPLGPGWFGEKDSRIYEVVYRDGGGRVHRAHVKTSMLSGVYLTNDRIIEEAPVRSVEEEKAALRKRLAELESRS